MQIIYGKELKKWANHTDMPETLIDQIDPDGFSIVSLSFPHRDDMSEWRLLVLFKLINNDEPVEGSLTMSGGAYKKIVKFYEADSEEVH